MTHKNNFQRTADWLAACGKQPGNDKQLAVQIGVDLEEFCEYLDELQIVGSNADNESVTLVSTRLKGVAHRLKMGHIGTRFRDRVNALDALCDREVTGNGVAFLAGMDKAKADERVLASNESKLNADGTPVILLGGKIGKSARYAPPFLMDLV